MLNALNELETKSEELGIDPSDVYPDFYEDLKDRVDNADAIRTKTLRTNTTRYSNMLVTQTFGIKH